MNKYKILLGSFMTAALMFSGCQDIDLLPKDNLSDVQYWKTPEDFMKEVNLMYDRAESFGTRDTDSDIGFELNENVTSNGTLIAPNKDGEWNDRYSDVRHCNIIIEKGTSYEGDKSKIERYIAEAHFFRAYTYWRLLKRFNEVSIVKEAVGVDSQELYGKRNSQAEVEDFILSELDNCWQSLPLQSELSGDELGRVTQGAALALKARVALFAGTWAKYHQHRSDYQQLLQQAIDAA